MAWEYSSYTAASYGIAFAIGVLITIFVLFIYGSSKRGEQFVIERIIGIEPEKAEDDDADDKGIDNGDVQTKLKTKKKWIKFIGWFFCFLGALSLSFAGILVFQGCFLASTRVDQGDKCPEYSVDCFVFNESVSSPPITNSVSFRCDRFNTTQFPSNMSKAVGWCYGWIMSEQTTKNVLDQLGVCTGLIGLYTTLLAIIVYLGRSIITIFVCATFIVGCLVAAIVLWYFRVSYAVLTYAVLALGIALGIFGVALFFAIPKRENNTTKKPISDINAHSNPTKPVHIKTIQRSSKVTPH